MEKQYCYLESSPYDPDTPYEIKIKQMDKLVLDYEKLKSESVWLGSIFLCAWILWKL